MTNLAEVVTTAMKAAGAGDADWRVQAAAAALLVLAGCAALGGRRILGAIREKRRGNCGVDRWP